MERYPEAFKYLIFKAFSGLGMASIVAISTTYFVEQTKLSQIQVVIVSAVVLVSGIPSAFIYTKLVKHVSMKKLWIALICGWLVLGVLTPYYVAEEGQFIEGIAVAVFFGIFVAWYFSGDYPGFAMLIPQGSEAEFVGIFGFFAYAPRSIAPAVYFAIVQATNQHQLALLHLNLYTIVAFVLLLGIDFKKGAQQAKDGGATVIPRDHIPLADSIMANVRAGRPLLG